MLFLLNCFLIFLLIFSVHSFYLFFVFCFFCLKKIPQNCPALFPVLSPALLAVSLIFSALFPDLSPALFLAVSLIFSAPSPALCSAAPPLQCVARTLHIHFTCHSFDHIWPGIYHVCPHIPRCVPAPPPPRCNPPTAPSPSIFGQKFIIFADKFLNVLHKPVILSIK